ncbi:MAG TPA: hypothetical protein EYP35_02990, partial [Desulfobacterales bacterium]|nr:hypothetical protein [Desulfobacterales bacterium]
MSKNKSCFDFLTKIVNTLKYKLNNEDYKILSDELFRNRDELLCNWLNVETLKGLIDKSYDKNKMREFIKLCLQKVIESGSWDTGAREKSREILKDLFGRRLIKINVKYKEKAIFCKISIRSSVETSKEIVNVE